MELTNRIDKYSDMLCKAIIATVMIVVILFCVSGITNAVARKVDMFNSFNTSDVTSDVRTRQLDCLTKNIYWEAASEPFEGKVAVAQVTLNRTNHASFPSDVCGVVYQKTAFQNKVVCQFSWFCERNYMVKPVHRREYEEAAAVARKVLLENFRIESVQDAIYYHADYVNPNWRKEKVAKIGRHIFYKG